jgi:hypothetical protein
MSMSAMKHFDSPNLVTKSLVTKSIEDFESSVRKELQKRNARLEVKMEQMRNHTILWTIGLFITSGLIAHFFK